MIRTHVIHWICGRAAFVWRWVTLAQFDALPHLTQKMILAKTVKMAVGGAMIACAGGGVWIVPHVVSEGGGYSVAPRAVHNVPEPLSLSILAVGGVALLFTRRRR